MNISLASFFTFWFLAFLGGCSSEREPENAPNTSSSSLQPSVMPETNATPEREIVLEEPGFVYPDGPVTIYYDDGTKHSTGSYKDGNKTGVWLYFGDEPEVPVRNEVFENGVKVSEESFE